jgi:hypothetical protein
MPSQQFERHGFDITSVERFERFIRATSGGALPYQRAFVAAQPGKREHIYVN